MKNARKEQKLSWRERAHKDFDNRHDDIAISYLRGKLDQAEECEYTAHVIDCRPCRKDLYRSYTVFLALNQSNEDKKMTARQKIKDYLHFEYSTRSYEEAKKRGKFKNLPKIDIADKVLAVIRELKKRNKR